MNLWDTQCPVFPEMMQNMAFPGKKFDSLFIS